MPLTTGSAPPQQPQQQPPQQPPQQPAPQPLLGQSGFGCDAAASVSDHEIGGMAPAVATTPTKGRGDTEYGYDRTDSLAALFSGSKNQPGEDLPTVDGIFASGGSSGSDDSSPAVSGSDRSSYGSAAGSQGSSDLQSWPTGSQGESLGSDLTKQLFVGEDYSAMPETKPQPMDQPVSACLPETEPSADPSAQLLHAPGRAPPDEEFAGSLGEQAFADEPADPAVWAGRMQPPPGQPPPQPPQQALPPTRTPSRGEHAMVTSPNSLQLQGAQSVQYATFLPTATATPTQHTSPSDGDDSLGSSGLAAIQQLPQLPNSDDGSAGGTPCKWGERPAGGGGGGETTMQWKSSLDEAWEARKSGEGLLQQPHGIPTHDMSSSVPVHSVADTSAGGSLPPGATIEQPLLEQQGRAQPSPTGSPTGSPSIL